VTTRRHFLIGGAAAGTALLVGFRVSAKTEDGPFRPNAWIAVGPDGRVTITVPHAEMGQGVRTAMPMVVADELEADWDAVELVQAVPGGGIQNLGTGGSDSIESGFMPMRLAGAAAREMLVAAAAATWSAPVAECRAERGSVAHAPSGRRLSYGALVPLARLQKIPANPALKPAFRLVGTPVRRFDGPRIVQGAALYGLDVRLPGMLFATVLRPPEIGGSLESFDGARARSLPGVRQVVAIPTGVAIVADDTWSALKARDAVTVAWNPGPHAEFSSEAFTKVLLEAAERPGVETRREGDPQAALAGAARRLSAVYVYPFEAHAPIEPMNYTADVQPGRCLLIGGTQNPGRVQSEAAKRLGLALDRVEVRSTLIGGAFGRRLTIDYALEALEVSVAAKAPVQVVWTRADDMQHGHFHPASAHRMEAGLDSQGRPVVWLHRKAGSFLSPPYRPAPAELEGPGAYQEWGQYDVPYAFPHILTDYTVVDSPVRTGPWRAVFSPPCTFARECFFDEIAHAGGKDPLRLRLDLLGDPQILKVGSLSIDRGRYRRVLELAAEKSGWGRPLPERDGRRFGRGLAGNVYDGSTHVAYVAEVSVGRDGDVKVERVVCAVDCGLPVNPLGIEGQVESGLLWGLSAALKGEITFRAGRVEQSTYGDYPVMRLRDTPAIEVYIVPGEARPRGLGEPPVPPAAPAVLNAVFAASGKRIRTLPLRPEALA
jgi:isoquinoline 1-oxidoreductase beta subunit